jgi:CubicO group peptidase (beta-lactamase class C family)
MMRKLGLLTLVFIAATHVIAQDKQKKLAEYFSALSQSEQFNGNVLIAENGKIVYEKSFGYADFAEKRVNTTQSSFPMASITKTFTSTAILQLKERKIAVKRSCFQIPS